MSLDGTRPRQGRSARRHIPPGQYTRRLRQSGRRRRQKAAIMKLAAYIVLVAVAAVLAVLRTALAPGANERLDETTLLVLQGPVEVQHPPQDFVRVDRDVMVRGGDRIRTGRDGYAVITWFDGSATSLGPDTDVMIRRLGESPSLSVQAPSAVRTAQIGELSSSPVPFVRTGGYQVRTLPDGSVCVTAEAVARGVYTQGSPTSICPTPE